MQTFSFVWHGWFFEWDKSKATKSCLPFFPSNIYPAKTFSFLIISFYESKKRKTFFSQFDKQQPNKQTNRMNQWMNGAIGLIFSDICLISVWMMMVILILMIAVTIRSNQNNLNKNKIFAISNSIWTLINLMMMM